MEVCRHLGYDDDYADDILNQIGQDGFISYEAFAQSNLALLTTDVSVMICMLSINISSLFRAGQLCLLFFSPGIDVTIFLSKLISPCFVTVHLLGYSALSTLK